MNLKKNIPLMFAIVFYRALFSMVQLRPSIEKVVVFHYPKFFNRIHLLAAHDRTGSAMGLVC